jgi:hypothetical protein
MIEQRRPVCQSDFRPIVITAAQGRRIAAHQASAGRVYYRREKPRHDHDNQKTA